MSFYIMYSVTKLFCGCETFMFILTNTSFKMWPQIKCLLFLLPSLAVAYDAKQYRFDYEWSEDAEGWMKYHAVPGTWEEARLRCHAEGAVLASPLTNKLKAAIVDFVKNKINTNEYQYFSIFSGVHCTFSKGDYTSVEGVPLLRLAVTWAPGEPDNYENTESCLQMVIDSYNNGTMSDTHCGRVLPYVCYRKYAKKTLTECGTTDPEYKLEPRTGSCYKYHKRALVWSEAHMTCIAEGGYLAIINNEEEAKIVSNIISTHPPNSIPAFNKAELFVGFHDWGHRGSNFMTIHGETLDVNYNSWHIGEPNNFTNPRTGDIGEFCGAVLRKEQTCVFNDYLCNVPTAFLCEKNPKSLL